MTDPRVEQYAQLLVERCLDVQPGWQVMGTGDANARPLWKAAARLIAERGAYFLPRYGFTDVSLEWLRHAPPDLVGTAAPIDLFSYEKMDALLAISAPENKSEGADVPSDRLMGFRQSRSAYLKRVLDWTLPWVGCNFPTPALAQDAGMSLDAYADFLYSACLLDWDAVARDMRRLADRFDAADVVHLVGQDTDLRFSLKGRQAKIDDGRVNMPGGEFFYSPVEDSAQGVITYADYPAMYLGHAVEGVRLEFENGRVVNATSRTDQDFLVKTLDSDEGARYLGELGVGCNPGIQRHMRDTLYDEKIYGTIHLALGAGFPIIGGKNVSNVHWDMVKNLRNGGRIFLDDQLVQENGKWLT